MKKSGFLLVSSVAMASLLAMSASAQEQNDSEPALDDFSDVQEELRSEDDTGADEGSVPEIAPDDGNNTVLAGSEAALERIAKVVARVDENATRDGNNWQLSIDATQILIVTDVNAGRMRIMTPIAAVEDLPEGGLLRLMQANFDSALDARYAVAQDLLWGTFIHPLPSLTERDFASGLLQTKTISDTFGTTFTSGAITFGGGDSNAIIGEQLEELLQELEKDAI